MLLKLKDYDKYLIQTSAGKDSVTMVLKLLEMGVDRDKIEMWHQCIDGKNDTKKQFFDWESTEGYVRKFAEHFNLKLVWSWREYGFWGELNKTNARSKDIRWQVEGEEEEHIIETTTQAKIATRQKFPAKSAKNLNARWCSSVLKISVSRRLINNREDLKGKKILMLTGERREESSNRRKYDELIDLSNSKRTLHHWRMIIDFKETQVWAIMQKYGIMPHPSYYLGFPRLSCKSCIFFSPNHWATLQEVDEGAIRMIRLLEMKFKFTLDNKLTIREMVDKGQSLVKEEYAHLKKVATSDWNESVYIDPSKWILPAGAFGKGGGAL